MLYFRLGSSDQCVGFCFSKKHNCSTVKAKVQAMKMFIRNHCFYLFSSITTDLFPSNSSA